MGTPVTRRGAVHLPMMEIPARMDEVPDDRDVVVVCRVGARSAQVVAYLLAQGWDRVANLDGGMFAWHAAGRALGERTGRGGPPAISAVTSCPSGRPARLRPPGLVGRAARAHPATPTGEAIDEGADGLECDVRLTRDGHLVCIHDAGSTGPATAAAGSARPPSPSWTGSTSARGTSQRDGAAEHGRRACLTLDRLLRRRSPPAGRCGC